MFDKIGYFRLLSPAMLGIALILSSTAKATANFSPSVFLAQASTPVPTPSIENHTSQSPTLPNANRDATPEQLMEQITSIRQLRDVSPQDWSYEALRNLVENYGCIVGYPDRTYRGDRPLSRNEFAAGLNACLQQLERRLARTTGTAFPTESSTQTLQQFPGEPIQEVFQRGFYHNTGTFFNISDPSGQLNNMFGWRTFPGSFFDNQIAADGEVLNTLLQDQLRQQVGTRMQTRDLPSPYDTSLRENPNYTRTQAAPDSSRPAVIIEQQPFFR
jgi:hypothetical protein